MPNQDWKLTEWVENRIPKENEVDEEFPIQTQDQEEVCLSSFINLVLLIFKKSTL